MSALAIEYAGRVECNVIPAEETANRGEEIDSYGFTEQLHGLVAFDADGVALVLIPGHQFGEPEIRAAIEKILAAE